MGRWKRFREQGTLSARERARYSHWRLSCSAGPSRFSSSPSSPRYSASAASPQARSASRKCFSSSSCSLSPCRCSCTCAAAAAPAFRKEKCGDGSWESHPRTVKLERVLEALDQVVPHRVGVLAKERRLVGLGHQPLAGLDLLRQLTLFPGDEACEVARLVRALPDKTIARFGAYRPD